MCQRFSHAASRFKKSLLALEDLKLYGELSIERLFGGDTVWHIVDTAISFFAATFFHFIGGSHW